jgi:general secretion pathway protein K
VKGEKGFALLITLIVTALLVAITTEFIQDVFVETSLSRSYADAQQASLAAASGVDGALKVLELSLKTKEYSSLLDPWATPQTIEEEKGSITVSITEESGKLDINSIVFPNGTLNQEYYAAARRLMERLEIPSTLCDAVADWIDEDGSQRSGGAESGYYRSLPSPYDAKNGPVESYEELRMVAGFDEAILRKLNPYITVYPEVQGSRLTRVNVNTAPAELLAVLDAGMNDDLAARIVEYRRKTPLRSSAEVTGIAGLETVGIALQGKISVKGSVFRIQSRAQVNDTVRIVEAVVRLSGTQPAVLYWREL